MRLKVVEKVSVVLCLTQTLDLKPRDLLILLDKRPATVRRGGLLLETFL